MGVTCMQNSHKSSAENMIARAFNCSEYTMMMQHSVLPEFLGRRLGMRLGDPGSREVWDTQCKEYFNIMSENIGITWHSIHYPFSLSQDNATIHHGATKAMLAPQVTPLEEYTTILTAAQDQLGINIRSAADAFEVVINRLKVASRGLEKEAKDAVKAQIAAANRARKRAVKTSTIQFLVDAKFKDYSKTQQPHAEEAHDIMLAEYTRAATANKAAPWEACFRRELAFKDPRWRCLVSEQLMPLGDTTPDLHQPAEMQVATYKGIAKAWTLDQSPESADLLLATSYNEVMHSECIKRNEWQDSTTPGKNHLALQGSIRRLYITAQIVAAGLGEVFYPWLAPGYDEAKGGHPTEFRRANFTVTGSDGRFPEGEWS